MVCVACALISEGISDNNTVAAPKNILFIVHIKYYFQIDRKGTLFCLLHQISGIFCRVL